MPNGAMSMVFLGTVITTSQSGSATMLGRVTALFYVVLVGSSAIGAPLMGWIADLSGPRVSIAIGGLAAMAIGAAGWCALRDQRAVASSGGIGASDLSSKVPATGS